METHQFSAIMLGDVYAFNFVCRRMVGRRQWWNSYKRQHRRSPKKKMKMQTSFVENEIHRNTTAGLCETR